MELLRVDRAHAAQARGITIVIDVVRAFSVAGYAFAGGARALWLVRTVEEARNLYAQVPDALLGGEIGGRLIPGFDFNNSPSQMATRDVRDKLLIQRTGAGTQGAVAVAHTDLVLLCALTNARATATYASQLAADLETPITLLPTFWNENDPAIWSEDDICADYLEALLRDQEEAAQDVLTRGIAHLHTSDRFAPWRAGYPDFPEADIEAVLSPNCFPFAIVGKSKEASTFTYIEAKRIDVPE